MAKPSTLVVPREVIDGVVVPELIRVEVIVLLVGRVVVVLGEHQVSVLGVEGVSPHHMHAAELCLNPKPRPWTLPVP